MRKYLLGFIGILGILNCSRESSSSFIPPEEASPPEVGETETPLEGVCPQKDVIQRTAQEGPIPSSIPRTYAKSCPKQFLDGEEDSPDIYIQACHASLVECDSAETALDCGKRALERGDWETALEQFSTSEAIENNRCQSTYGRYLARLFRNYTHFNHLFFDDVIEPSFNRHKSLRALYIPLTTWGHTYHSHFDCLYRDSYLDATSQQTEFEKDLEEIWKNDCTLRATDGGPLPIRYTQGKCGDPLLDLVFVGVWDKVDAFFAAYMAPGSPYITLRSTVANLYKGPNTEPCLLDSGVCSPLFVESTDGSPLEIPRLPLDVENFLELNFQSLKEMDNPNRNPNTVFYYRDSDNDGKQSYGDGAFVRSCDFNTGESTLDYSNTTVGSLWKYRQATPPKNPSKRQTEIYCGPFENEGKECPLFEGEVVLDAFPPFPVPNEYNLSPDGTKVAFLLEIGGGFHQVYVTDKAGEGIVRATDKQMGERPPLCNGQESLDKCCITCKTWPQGFQIGIFDNQPNMGLLPQWIKGPDGEPVGLFFQVNEHPSSWGWQGQGQAIQFYAIRLDGTGASPLLPKETPPGAWGFQAHLSPDGKQIFWTGSWNPESLKLIVDTLLFADLIYEEESNPPFRMEKIRFALPGLDHGFYEANGVSPEWPEDKSLLFTGGGFSKQSLRLFMGTFNEKGVLDNFIKLNWPGESSSEPFVVDNHPAWYEHSKLLDKGQQVFFLSTQGNPAFSDGANHFSERIDHLLKFPPFYDGFYSSLSTAEMRFFSMPGYYTEDFTPYYIRYWISNIDGTDLELVTGSEPEKNGWVTHSVGVQNGAIYFVQSKDTHKNSYCRTAWSKNKCERRYGVVRFATNP
ncbi:MAG: hypothetical protein HY538_08425 [Deltaproteobacteria bacterium]|nr:hypothetical protein [Deltaproteobacteria bacterium]